MLEVIRFPNKFVNYRVALQLQQELVNRKLLNRPNEPDYLIILQHEPCITLGRRCHDTIIESTIPVIKSPRGGLVTYHGPGQLTCYPILDLKRQPVLSLTCYVQNLAAVMTKVLAQSYHITDAFYDSDPKRVGLWLPGNKKIGFIGIQAQKWITSHGFSLNVQSKCLKGFEEVDPCGLKGTGTEIVCATDEVSNFETIEKVLVDSFQQVFYNKRDNSK